MIHFGVAPEHLDRTLSLLPEAGHDGDSWHWWCEPLGEEGCYTPHVTVPGTDFLPVLATLRDAGIPLIQFDYDDTPSTPLYVNGTYLVVSDDDYWADSLLSLKVDNTYQTA